MELFAILIGPVVFALFVLVVISDEDWDSPRWRR